MSRASSLSPPPPAKRIRLVVPLRCTSTLNYRGGLFLAPMVRSGALPTRLYSLAYGASLVWAPEIVDRAMLHATRDQDESTGVISYRGTNGKPIFTTHPLEKRRLVYQIGSATPELALQAALRVVADVSAVDLNCGCPKPFSTHGGMGAALLSTPDLLCDILRTLREGLPPEIAVTAKIRLLKTQEETIDLVKRIIECGVSAVTVHCRTREMRKGERALPHRLKGIVDAVKALPGGGVPIIANGDCKGVEDAIKLRELTGADSVMIATAAESNPTCFSREPLSDLEAHFVPRYLRLARYLDNVFGSTKHCVVQFKSSTNTKTTKAERTRIREVLAHAKEYEAFDDLVGGDWDGESEFRVLEETIRCVEAGLRTPFGAPNPEGGALLVDAPGPLLSRAGLEMAVAGARPATPTPGSIPHLLTV
ncbi:FMN-linked oxidoreductase [Auricularia subglabra TFB-10046 SS5]|nr:FMN-linked oxidoreductase [Auricularia subglabra TFB-10046 SS5]